MYCTTIFQNLDPDSSHQTEGEASVSKLKVAISNRDMDTIEMLLDGGKYAAVRLVLIVLKTRMRIEQVKLSRVGFCVLLVLDRDGRGHQAGLWMVSSHVCSQCC